MIRTPQKLKHKDTTWRQDLVKKLRAYKSRSAAQQLLVDLAHETGDVPDPDRTDSASSKDDETAKKNLDTLYRAEAARERFDAITNRATRIAKGTKETREKSKRELRNKRLIDQALLIELAGLHERTEAVLLGLLLDAAQVTDPERLDAWAKAGAERLAARDAARAKS